MTLGDWYAEPVDHRARMMACVLADAKVELYRHWYAEQKLEREQNRDGDTRTFSKLKQRLAEPRPGTEPGR
jgi:rhamnogalacturonyl hydrolase YesR